MSHEDEVTRRELLRQGGAAGAGLILGSGLLAGEAVAGGNKKRALPQVPRRALGNTGQKVPILLVGGGVSLDPVFDPKLAEALRYGVNYIDTADCYGGGTSEPAVGSFHTRAKARDKLWITSKSDEHDPEGFAKTLATSLSKLRTSYVDAYFLHALEDPRLLNSKLQRTVERLKKQGKLRHFGFSCHQGNVVELLDKAAKTPWVEIVMFRYNFRRYGDKALNKAMDACAKAKVGLIAMKTQASASSFKERWAPFEKTGTWNKYQVALKAVWADERISGAVSAMDTLEKVRENVAAALDRHKLGALEREELERYAEATRAWACDGCHQICAGACGSGVRIADTMRYLMYHDAYGQPERAQTLFRALPPEARRLTGVDFSAASAACPNGIDIHWHMRRAAEILG